MQSRAPRHSCYVVGQQAALKSESPCSKTCTQHRGPKALDMFLTAFNNLAVLARQGKPEDPDAAGYIDFTCHALDLGNLRKMGVEDFMRQAGRRCAKPGEDHLAARFAACDQNDAGTFGRELFGGDRPNA